MEIPFTPTITQWDFLYHFWLYSMGFYICKCEEKASIQHFANSIEEHFANVTTSILYWGFLCHFCNSIVLEFIISKMSALRWSSQPQNFQQCKFYCIRHFIGTFTRKSLKSFHPHMPPIFTTISSDGILLVLNAFELHLHLLPHLCWNMTRMSLRKSSRAIATIAQTFTGRDGAFNSWGWVF